MSNPSINRTLDAFRDEEALARLRCDTFDSVGPESGIGILYGLGFTQGMRDGIRSARAFEENDGRSSHVGTGLPITFQPDGVLSVGTFQGRLPRSIEARLHLAEFPTPAGPICFVSAGYAAGWYSAMSDQIMMVRETHCKACANECCRFECRPLSDWQAAGADWVNDLLPYLDFDTIRNQAERMAQAPEGLTEEELEDGPDDTMMGGFDSMSPAVHVWGPVMILPYSGTEDCLVALDAVREDVGYHQISVVVIDATGIKVDAIEAVGLTMLLDALESENLETVLVGLEEAAEKHFCTQKALRRPILAKGISEGITLGFQMAGGSR